MKRPLRRLTKLPGSPLRFLKRQTASVPAATLLSLSAFHPLSWQLEGVHVKDERSCAFKRAVLLPRRSPSATHTPPVSIGEAASVPHVSLWQNRIAAPWSHNKNQEKQEDLQQDLQQDLHPIKVRTGTQNCRGWTETRSRTSHQTDATVFEELV